MRNFHIIRGDSHLQTQSYCTTNSGAVSAYAHVEPIMVMHTHLKISPQRSKAVHDIAFAPDADLARKKGILKMPWHLH